MDAARPTPKFLDKRLLELRFADGAVLHYPADHLRAKCPCAPCTTGDDGGPTRLLSRDDFAGVEFKGLMQVGTYAFRILFSDGHSVGLYPFDALRARRNRTGPGGGRLMTATTEAPKAAGKAAACGPIRPSKASKRRLVALILVHVAVLVHVAHWKIAGTTLTPLEPSESMQTLELGYVNAGFLLFVGAILLTMVVGRFFCGWACHVVAYQDACAWILGKLKLKPKPVRSRLLVSVPLGAAFYMFAWPTVYRFTMNLAGADFPWPKWVLHLTTDDLWRTFPGRSFRC
jgi:DUF971 family protein